MLSFKLGILIKILSESFLQLALAYLQGLNGLYM